MLACPCVHACALLCLVVQVERVRERLPEDTDQRSADHGNPKTTKTSQPAARSEPTQAAAGSAPESGRTRPRPRHRRFDRHVVRARSAANRRHSIRSAARGGTQAAVLRAREREGNVYRRPRCSVPVSAPHLMTPTVGSVSPTASPAQMTSPVRACLSAAEARAIASRAVQRESTHAVQRRADGTGWVCVE
jgi:hypothetical protein